MAAEIKRNRGLDSDLVRGSGGVFEVQYDGRTIYSKRETGRFPEVDEVLDQIPVSA